MKKIFLLFVALLSLTAIVACSESSDEVNEYENWQQRNAVFMKDTLAYANRQIAEAQARWPEDWEAHCPWRVFASYRTTTGGKTTWEDSIAVRVITAGQGSGSPCYTDSVRVVYAGRLMGTDSYRSDNPAEYFYHYPGFVFDHSGLSSKVMEIMDPRFETPVGFKAGTLVEGFTTALLNMHVGDYWRIYIPSNLGYGSSGSSDKIPAYSTLVFDLRLKGYARAGSPLK